MRIIRETIFTVPPLGARIWFEREWWSDASDRSELAFFLFLGNLYPAAIVSAVRPEAAGGHHFRRRI
jgi:hypothetical protein